MSRKLFGRGPLVASLVSLGLASCGGGGGGGGGDAPGGGVITPPVTPPTILSNWRTDLKPGSTVVAAGKAIEMTYTIDSSGRMTVSAPTAIGDATYTQTMNASGVLSSTHIDAPSRTLRFAVARGDAFGRDGDLIAAQSADKQSQALARDPEEPPTFSYQSYGAWTTGIGTASGSFGVISVGAKTPADAIPPSGWVSFSGSATGVFVDDSGADSLTRGHGRFLIDFRDRRGTFEMSDFTRLDNTSLEGTGFTGVLSYAAGENRITGTVNTSSASRSMTGDVTGYLYGPRVQEFGGVFSLSSTPDSLIKERHIGSFGMTAGSGNFP